MHSECCSEKTREWLRSTEIDIERCGCGTLWAKHAEIPEGNPWSAPGIDDTFLAALKRRREIQAERIADRLGTELGTVLDYACGQGVLTARLIANGVDAYGCDLDPSRCDEVPQARRLACATPWGWPAGEKEFTTLVLLDVLEHIPSPVEFLAAAKVERVVIKVPLVGGPIATASRTLARVGKDGLLKSLFLVGDQAPHLAYYSAAGLEKLLARAGFSLERKFNLAEVGAELPDRMRGRRKNAALRAAGTTLLALSSVWSDTAVFVFRASSRTRRSG